MNIKTVFVNETDSIAEVLLRYPDIFSEGIPENLKALFKKQFNNWVGFSFFEKQGNLIQLIILPKIIDREIIVSENILLEKFKYYLNFVAQVLYNEDRRMVGLPLIGYGNQSIKSDLLKNGERLNIEESFKERKYVIALSHLCDFIKTEFNDWSYYSVQKPYNGVSVRDVRKNVISPNKSLLCKTKTVNARFSPQLELIWSALNLFLKTNSNLCSKSFLIQNQSKVLLKALRSFLNFDSVAYFSKNKILSKASQTLFNGSRSTTLAYSQIAALLDADVFLSEKDNHMFNMLGDGGYFFRAELIFEKYVAHMYRLSPERWTVREKNTVIYNIIGSSLSSVKEVSSKPDVIAKNSLMENRLIDAKWKILDFTDSKKGIDEEDIRKLERDYRVRVSEGNNKTIKLFLSYPMIIQNTTKTSAHKGPFEFNIQYSPDDVVTVYVEEIPLPI